MGKQLLDNEMQIGESKMQLRMGLDSRMSRFHWRQKAVGDGGTFINQATVQVCVGQSQVVGYSCSPGTDCPGQPDAFNLAKPFWLWNFAALRLDLWRHHNFPGRVTT